MHTTTNEKRCTRRIAWFLLLAILIPAIAPVSFVVNVPVANAQCSGGSCGGGSGVSSGGGLGSLLSGSGGMQNMMLLMMLMSMLMQLFSGSTPQTGTSEETPSQTGTVNATQSGTSRYGNGSYSSGSTNSYGLGVSSIFFTGDNADSQTLLPESTTISSGQGVNFFNTTEDDKTVKIYKGSETTASVNKTVTAGSGEVFTFTSTGTYKFCIINNDAESCQATVTVQ